MLVAKAVISLCALIAIRPNAVDIILSIRIYKTIGSTKQVELCSIPFHIDIHGDETGNTLTEIDKDKVEIQHIPSSKIEREKK